MSENNFESAQFRKVEALIGRRDTKMAKPLNELRRLR